MPYPGVPAEVCVATIKSEPNDQNIVDPVSVQKPPNSVLDEALLICDICLEIMHSPMNISPCNHKFCASCIYGWLEQKKNCPKCRWCASEVTRDALFNQVIEGYLNAFPARKRNEATLTAMDEAELEYLKKKQDERNREQREQSDSDGEVHELPVGLGHVVNGILPRLIRLRGILGNETNPVAAFIDEDFGRDPRYRHAEMDARIQRLQRQKDERDARVRQERAQARRNRLSQNRQGPARRYQRAAPPSIATPTGPYNLRRRAN